MRPTRNSWCSISPPRSSRCSDRFGKLDRIDVAVGPGEDFAARGAGHLRCAAGVLPARKAGHAQRRKPAYAARLPLEPARAQLHFAGGGGVPDLQHHRGERGAAAGGDRRAARNRRFAGFTILSLFLERSADVRNRRRDPGNSVGSPARGRNGGADRRNRERALHHQPSGGRILAAPNGTEALLHARHWRGRGVCFHAWAPAREAMRVAPVQAMGRGEHEHRSRLRWRRGLAWSAVFACVLAALAAFRRRRLWTAIRSAATQPRSSGHRFATRPGRSSRGADGEPAQRAGGASRAASESLLAGRSLAGSLARTAVMVAALATAVAMMASVGIMVGSFRETVALWLDVQLRADLYHASPPSRAVQDCIPPSRRKSPQILSCHPHRRIAAVDLFHALEISTSAGERANARRAGNLEIVRRYGRLRFLAGDRIATPSCARCRIAIAPSPASRSPISSRVRAGDRLTVPLSAAHSVMTPLIAGIHYEYSSSQGFLIVDRSTLLKYLPDQLPPTNIAVYLAHGVDSRCRTARNPTANRGPGDRHRSQPPAAPPQHGSFRPHILHHLGARSSGRAGRHAGSGQCAACPGSRPAPRARPAALPGSVSRPGAGHDPHRVRVPGPACVAWLGLVLGSLVLSLLLVFVVNKQSFGWTIQFHPPLALLAAAVLLVWCVTALRNGLYPARVAARLQPHRRDSRRVA